MADQIYDLERQIWALEADMEHDCCEEDFELLEKLQAQLSEARSAARRKASDSDVAWQRERAMEAGMAFGVDAYNEIMGS